MSVRANTSNKIGIGTSQVSGGNVATAATYVTTFPRPSGQTLTVLATSQGATAGDNVERDSDGGFWDTVAGVPVAVDNTTVGIDSMRST